MTINGWTLALQAINFLVLVWLLQRFLYKPVVAVLAKRRQLVEQAFAEAETAKSAATAEGQRLQESQADLARSRQDLLKKAHAEMETERARIVEDARLEAAAMLDAARAQIVGERETAVAEVRAQVADLAVEMATTLLQQVTALAAALPALNDGFLAQVSDRLDQLTGEERAAFGRDLETAEAGLQVVTGMALGPDEQQRWRGALEDRLGPVGPLEFIVDPAFIGGAELRFPHGVLSFAWSELLQTNKETLLAD